MTTANVNDRRSLEAAYPPEAYASDATQNEKVASELTHGVRVGSAPDKNGTFELERIVRHAGEAMTPDFLAPTRRTEQPAEAEPRAAPGYWRFLDDIVAAAERFGFRAEESPGKGDARIRGLRQ